MHTRYTLSQEITLSYLCCVCLKNYYWWLKILWQIIYIQLDANFSLWVSWPHSIPSNYVFLLKMFLHFLLWASIPAVLSLLHFIIGALLLSLSNYMISFAYINIPQLKAIKAIIIRVLYISKYQSSSVFLLMLFTVFLSEKDLAHS